MVARLRASLLPLYYTFGMTSNPGRETKTPLPPPPPRERLPITPLEAWYRQCLAIMTAHLKRPPSIYELAAWIGKSRTSVYAALCSLEHKGAVRRRPADRRFVLVGKPNV
jgi:hypothetical protein